VPGTLIASTAKYVVKVTRRVTTSSQPFLKEKAGGRVSSSGGEAGEGIANARGVRMHGGRCRCGGWREDWLWTVIGEVE